jgi:heterodisulfide reductase subunit B
LEASGRNYDISARAVFEALGEPLQDLDDWNCCGATAYMSVREFSSFAVTARNLALAEREGHDILTACPACYTCLLKCSKYCKDDKVLLSQIAIALRETGMDFHNRVRVRHILDVLHNDIGHRRLQEKARYPLSGMRIAPYYGCQVTRPYAEFDDPEFPTAMDKILKWVGAEVVDFPLKARCCGGMMSTSAPQVAMPLIKKLLNTAIEQGADAIAVACPMCYFNLDAYQKDLSNGRVFNVPIVYFTQLVGLSFGIAPEKLGLEMGMISAKPLLAKLRETTAATARREV